MRQRIDEARKAERNCGHRGYDAAVSAISDPSRPSWRDRRRAQKLVDTAFAERRLTAADRTLRTQRIEAAHTRGDLAMITRDLVAPVQTNLGRALDARTMSSMRVGAKAGNTPRTPSAPSAMSPGTPTIDLSGIGRKVRVFVLIAVVGMFASCVLGLAAFVIPAFFAESNRAADTGSPGVPGASVTPEDSSAGVDESDAASLHSAEGWTELVDAIERESGTTEVYDLVVYPTYASVGLDGEDAIERRLFRAGDWQEGFSARTPINGSVVDLGEIEPETVAGLSDQTARHFGIDEPTGTYIIVNAFAGVPRIMVYVQSSGESQYRVYRLDGTAIS